MRTATLLALMLAAGVAMTALAQANPLAGVIDIRRETGKAWLGKRRRRGGRGLEKKMKEATGQDVGGRGDRDIGVRGSEPIRWGDEMFGGE